ncbi:MAG: hypothetical protein CTY31_10675 [Hyphomicrobium sp.]|nr:MAG: hypothetical protein CTY31_10675 [Hyphomicrobium sp.]
MTACGSSAGSGRRRKKDGGGFKVKLRGKDNAPLSMPEMRDGLYEIARRLQPFQDGYRVKRATLYLTVVDADGNEVLLTPEGEWTIYPYKCAADEFGA